MIFEFVLIRKCLRSDRGSVNIFFGEEWMENMGRLGMFPSETGDQSSISTPTRVEMKHDKARMCIR